MRVALIIPNRNNARFLGQCLESALVQTRPYDEIIVVDDASDDDSVAVVRAYTSHDDRVRLLALPERGGVARARDIGIRSTTTTHLATLDSDDFFWGTRKNELECALIQAAVGSAPIIAFSDIRWVSAGGADLGSVAARRPVREGDIFGSLLFLSGFIPRDFVFSREAYFAVGGYDPSFALYEDWDLKLRLARRCMFRFTGADGVAYRRGGSGLSEAPWLAHHRAMCRVMQKNTLALPPVRRSAVRVTAFLRILWFHRGLLKAALLG